MMSKAYLLRLGSDLLMVAKKRTSYKPGIWITSDVHAAKMKTDSPGFLGKLKNLTGTQTQDLKKYWLFDDGKDPKKAS